MAQALRNCGRDIVFAACNWGVKESRDWMRSHGADTYRSTYDISDNPESFIKIFRSQCFKMENNTAGCYNDMDMLTVGMFGNGNVANGGCTADEYDMEFAMWAFLGVPLIIGGDIRNMDERSRKLLQHEGLIAINQDIECRPAFPVSGDDRLVFCKLLSDGTFALLFINGDEQQRMLSCITHDIGYTVGSGYKIHMRDILSGEEMIQGDFPVVTVPGRDCRIFKCKLVK